jgi:hypothetical protein
MKRIETRNQVKTMVDTHTEGITLTELHTHFQRLVTRLQLRTLLRALVENNEITAERMLWKCKKQTVYFPFSGAPNKKRKKKIVKLNNSRYLTVKDFKRNGAYTPFADR